MSFGHWCSTVRQTTPTRNHAQSPSGSGGPCSGRHSFPQPGFPIKRFASADDLASFLEDAQPEPRPGTHLLLARTNPFNFGHAPFLPEFRGWFRVDIGIMIRTIISIKGGGSPQPYYHDCSGKIPGHTTGAPPVGFDLETNGHTHTHIPGTRSSTTSTLSGWPSSRSAPPGRGGA